jgi:hypothetical protein
MQQHVLDSSLRSEWRRACGFPSLGCRGPLHNTNTRRNKKPAPAESAAVRRGKLQSKGLGFGASCERLLGFTHSSRTETYGTRGGD